MLIPIFAAVLLYIEVDEISVLKKGKFYLNRNYKNLL